MYYFIHEFVFFYPGLPLECLSQTHINLKKQCWLYKGNKDLSWNKIHKKILHQSYATELFNTSLV